jgi:formylglycine-generating enzyme required for sulfatase activity
VHSATYGALTRWNQPIPTNGSAWLAPTRRPPGDRDWFVNGQAMTMVRIPTNTFLMGSDKRDKDERPRHQVVLTNGFWMSDREVTLGLFRRFLNDPAWASTNKPLDWESDFAGGERFSPSADCPAQSVSWLDAVGFCNWLSDREGRSPCYQMLGGNREQVDWRCDFKADGYRLPTEAEWEYACRSLSNGEYAFRDDDTLVAEYAWTAENSRRRTWPAGGRLANGWGLFDMPGNVWEWCNDRYEPYPQGIQIEPKGPQGAGLRALRGGSWENDRDIVRCAFRYWDYPLIRGTGFGFRVVVSPF